MRGFRGAFILALLIGALSAISCRQSNSQHAKDAENKAKSEEQKRQDEADLKATVEKELSHLAARHKAVRNWLSFAEDTGLEHQTFTLEYQDALVQLGDQLIVVVGYVSDVRRMGNDYRILCVCCAEPSHQEKGIFLNVAFDLNADAAVARSLIETAKNPKEVEKYSFPLGFAFVVRPTRLKVTHNREVSAEGRHEDDITSAEIVEGNLYPRFTILGECREVRYLKGFLPF